MQGQDLEVPSVPGFRGLTGSTDSKLLEQIRDWGDFRAWLRFLAKYDPHLVALCRSYGLSGEPLEECRQVVWIQLAEQMRRFRYDPGLRFRGWLHRFFSSRIIDFLRKAASQDHADRLGDPAFIDVFTADDDHCDPHFLAMLRKAEVIQEAVRNQVKPENWLAYWLIAVEGWSIDETKNHQNRSYAAVFRAYKRVCRMVEDQRERSNVNGEPGTP
jgi:RNA polymerase sigma factor (sigma-70 family)